ncbi:MAG: dihydropteroate synthase [Fibrobacter sp.]|nr:dihydropteroate synthase [Fibrobacter sp.]
MMNHPYIQLIEKKIPVIFDGAFGTQIQKSNISVEKFLTAPGCNEILNITCPEKISAIHTEYLKAGANVIETNSFGGSRVKLGEFGLQEKVYEINKASAVNARNAIESYKVDRPMFVCGSMGPTGYLPSSKDPNLIGADFNELADIFEEQAKGLYDGGVDLYLIETSQDLLEVRAAIVGIRRMLKKEGAFRPIQVQITIDSNGRMLLGSGIESFLGAVIALNPSVVGFNCGMGPLEMLPTIEKLLKISPIPVSALPNAGMPRNIDGKAVYSMEPQKFAEALLPLVTESGLEVVGGCCGTKPDHIAALSSILKGKTVAERTGTGKKSCWVATGIGGIDLETVKRPVIIGERLNTQGSKKTKELVLAQNYDELLQIAQEQIDTDSSLLDICVAVSEKDNEKDTMKNIVSYLSDRSETPFCIDSTEPSVMQSALWINPGSVMLNSINLEHKGERARKILELACNFGCPVVALTIDDAGMAKTLDRKMELTRKLRDLACGEFGLPEHYLYIDPLVFTLATGEAESADAALVSLDALRCIKSVLPGIRTVMGVSNVSFGLKPKARRILNNLMLHHAVEAGLDAAIFNPIHLDDIQKYDKTLRNIAEDLLFNRKADALMEYVKYFESAELESTVKQKSSEELPVEKRLYNAIIKRDRRNLAGMIETVMQHESATDILNKILLPAMGEVGNMMSRGDIILPFVLQAAEVMKEAVSILEPHLKTENSTTKGKFVLATVYGDVHDIGKNLVGSILRNQGFEVIDLGKQVPVDAIIEAVKKAKPAAVGLSALLVTTSKQMALCVEEFDKQNISVPVIIGGAAVNKEYASIISTVNGKKYSGGVFYAKDAFDATRILDTINSSENITPADSSAKHSTEFKEKECKSAESLEYGPHIEPPFWGTSEILVWDAAAIINGLNLDRLFKAGWGGGNLNERDYAHAKETQFEPAFERLRNEIIEQELIDLRGFYGLFPVITDDDQLIMIDPSDFHTEIANFRFPRMEKSGGRSIADYFKADGDIIGVQAVTIGRKLSDRCREYFHKEDRYSNGFFLNALGNFIVENLAEKITTEIRRAMGISADIGRRYSFGYPGLPSLEEQRKLFDIMGVEDRLDIVLTSGFQMEPEHSTMGIFVHHPSAEYLI